MSPCLLPTLAIVVAVVASTTDLRSGRIPNVLTFPAMLLGLVIQGLGSGVAGLLESLLGLVVCAAVPGVVYKASQGKGIGGGDIKLFAALGAMLGPTQGLEAELSSFLLLGLFALFRLAFQGQLWRTLRNTLYLMVGAVVPRLRHSVTAADTPMTEMRMGLAIALGVLTVLCTPYLLRCLPWLA